MTTMSELSPRARQVLRLSQKPPTLADRERIQNALRARLGTTTLPTGEGKVLPSARARWTVVSTAIIGAGLIGGALFLMTRHEPESAIPAQASVTSAMATSSASPVSAPLAESATVAVLPTAASSEPSAPSSHPAPDRLAQEVAFLERATSALHAGHASNALQVLDEYQRKFPNGLLTLERGAARAQALCSLGRRSEAQAELSRLPAQSPGVARAKQVCDASSKAAR
jgi:hypothetical protein